MEPTVNKYFKNCFVYLCRNSTCNAPNKIFVRVPKYLEAAWFKPASKKTPNIGGNYYCCEDHFNVSTYMDVQQF